MVELLVVIAILGMLMGILVPSLAAKEVVRQAKCRTQLRGFGNSLHAYAAEMNEKWPCVVRPTVSGQQKIDTMASLWLMVVRGHARIEEFICQTEEVTGRATAYRGVIDPKIPFPLQDNKLTISYSYQVPHSITGYPGKDHAYSTRFAIMADRNPFDPKPTPPPPGGKLISSATGWSNKATANDIDTFVRGLKETERQSINSSNHSGEGQNVLYRDGHAEWRMSPLPGSTRTTSTPGARTTA